MANVPEDDVKSAHTSRAAILEKGDSLGGTWRDNTYPSCACDAVALQTRPRLTGWH